MPDPIRFNLATLGQLQAPANPGIGWVGPERPAESWADIAADPLSALFDVGRGAVTGDAPAGMNLQGLGALIAAAMPVAGGAKALRAATKAATISELADEAAQRSMSVLKDMHGEPLVVYRGRTPGATGPVRSSVAYFTPQESAAREYSLGLDEGAQPNVLAAHLHLSNPAKESDVLRVAKQYGLSLPDEAHPIAYLEGHPDLVKRLRDEGFDGVVGSDRRFDDRGPITSYGVFDAHQVKPLTERPAAPTGIKAYHGSPHDFDQFSMSKIGTGEGAQAYGHGLYFAENPGVAAGYRDALSGTSVTPNLEIDPKAVERLGFKSDSQFGTVKQYITNAVREAKGDLPKAAQYLRNGAESQVSGAEHLGPEYMERAKKFSEQAHMAAEMIDSGAVALADNPGKMYEVQIHASPDQFLDWDKPLSEQSEHVKTATAALIADAHKRTTAAGQAILEALPADATGAEVHAALSRAMGGTRFDQTQLQAAAKDVGIPGIRYLDAGSRSAGEGSRNYVIFDEKLVSILKKYGVALPVIEGLREKAQKGGGVVPSSDVHSLVQQ